MADDKRRKILVADDDNLVMKTVMDVIKSTGYHATGVSDGESAISEYEKERPDMLITDYSMGCGKTGIDVVKEIREKYKDARIIVMSGSNVEKEAREAGAVDYLTKPVYPDVLRSAIKKHLPEENQQPA
jgi:two-component system chemotaxis response regulator CheY